MLPPSTGGCNSPVLKGARHHGSETYRSPGRFHLELKAEPRCARSNCAPGLRDAVTGLKPLHHHICKLTDRSECTGCIEVCVESVVEAEQMFLGRHRPGAAFHRQPRRGRKGQCQLAG